MSRSISAAGLPAFQALERCSVWMDEAPFNGAIIDRRIGAEKEWEH